MAFTAYVATNPTLTRSSTRMARPFGRIIRPMMTRPVVPVSALSPRGNGAWLSPCWMESPPCLDGLFSGMAQRAAGSQRLFHIGQRQPACGPRPKQRSLELLIACAHAAHVRLDGCHVRRRRTVQQGVRRNHERPTRARKPGPPGCAGRCPTIAEAPATGHRAGRASASAARHILAPVGQRGRLHVGPAPKIRWPQG